MFRATLFVARSTPRKHLQPATQSRLLAPRRYSTHYCCGVSRRQADTYMVPPDGSSKASSKRNLHATKQATAQVALSMDGKDEEFSTILLRDLCKCSACIHEHSGQRLYSVADIPINLRARSVNPGESAGDTVNIQWENDVPGFDSQHTTSINIDTLRTISKTGAPPSPSHQALPRQVLWDASSDKLPDFEYGTYMNDDATLFKVMNQLRTHGLVFITGVPGIEKSVSTIAERIGPVKDTFYGHTWDVRTVPKAVNAAYTSGDLGFHTDLLYFQNPPHVQLLHCIESSSTGGASVFADAFKSALDLYSADEDAFNVLATLSANYHYEHPDSNLYRTTKPVIDTRPLRIGDTAYATLHEFLRAWEDRRQRMCESRDTELAPLDVVDCLEKINWGPPFLAPFSLDPDLRQRAIGSSESVRECLNQKVTKWHAAATKFSALLQRPESLRERLMKPGECVLFDNTRVLHARTAFNSNDVGKARWLRGTYVDKDPYLSKLRVLRHKFEPASRAANPTP